MRAFDLVLAKAQLLHNQSYASCGTPLVLMPAALHLCQKNVFHLFVEKRDGAAHDSYDNTSDECQVLGSLARETTAFVELALFEITGKRHLVWYHGLKHARLKIVDDVSHDECANRLAIFNRLWSFAN